MSINRMQVLCAPETIANWITLWWKLQCLLVWLSFIMVILGVQFCKWWWFGRARNESPISAWVMTFLTTEWEMMNIVVSFITESRSGGLGTVKWIAWRVILGKPTSVFLCQRSRVLPSMWGSYVSPLHYLWWAICARNIGHCSTEAGLSAVRNVMDIIVWLIVHSKGLERVASGRGAYRIVGGCWRCLFLRKCWWRFTVAMNMRNICPLNHFPLSVVIWTWDEGKWSMEARLATVWNMVIVIIGLILYCHCLQRWATGRCTRWVALRRMSWLLLSQCRWFLSPSVSRWCSVSARDVIHRSVIAWLPTIRHVVHVIVRFIT